MQTRKEFLKNIGTVASGLAVLPFVNPDSFAAISKSGPVYFDLHSHAGWSIANGVFEPSATFNKSVNEMHEGHLTGALLALVADAPLLKPGPTGISVTRKYTTGEGWNEYKRQLALQKNAFANVQEKLSTEWHDLNVKRKKTICYLAVEGADFLENQPGRIEDAYRDGVRSIQLVHYAPNEVGDLQTAVAIFNGLSAFGKEVVKKMNALGMVIDLAHASFETTKDVANLTKAPIILSHSILQMEADRPMSRRAISKEHAKLIAETGGVIGAWPSAFNKNFDDYVDNIKRLVDVVGIRHVGIGTDMDANFKPVLTSYTQFGHLAAELELRGFSHKEANMIMGGNARDVLERIMKK